MEGAASSPWGPGPKGAVSGLCLWDLTAGRGPSGLPGVFLNCTFERCQIWLLGLIKPAGLNL